MSKYAIFSLCMLNKHYVVGACISGYTHKCFISRLNKKIDMVVMCDKAIYDEFKDVLKDAQLLLEQDYARAKSTCLFSGRDESLFEINQSQCLGRKIGKVAFIDENKFGISSIAEIKENSFSDFINLRSLR